MAQTLTVDTDLQGCSCAWVTPVLGVRGRLLYFGPLLRDFARRFASFRVIAGEFGGDAGAAGFQIEVAGSFRRLYQDDRIAGTGRAGYARGISIASPVALRSLRRDPADLVIINEFSLFCFYAALIRLWRPRTRLLCIVESRPRFQDSRLLALARRLFRRSTGALVHQFLTNNQAGFDYLTGSIGINPDRILVRPYLVSDLGGPPPAVRRRTGTDSRQPLTFVYAGDLVKRKGLLEAVTAFRDLDPERRSRCQLLIAGDGPLRPELDALVRAGSLESTVTFLGRLPYEEMRSLYDRADVFVFPTLGDYRALSPFEAMSRGAAILGSVFDGGSEETVTDNGNGYRFDPTVPGDLTGKLVQLLDHPERIETFSQRSLEMAQRYTLPAAVDALAEASRRALGLEPRTSSAARVGRL